MHITSRRNMLALPVERLVGNNHHSHHLRLSLSPDSNISDSSSSAGENSHSHGRTITHSVTHHHQHEGLSETITTSSMMMSPMSPRDSNNSSSGSSNYSLVNTPGKVHLIKSQVRNSPGTVTLPTTANPKISPSSSTPPPTPLSPCSDGDEDECIDIVGNDANDDFEDETSGVPLNYHQSHNNNPNRIRDHPYYRNNLNSSNNNNNNNSNRSSRSRSPKIKYLNRACSATTATTTNTVVTGAEGEMITIKSEVDTHDRLAKKEPSSPLQSPQSVLSTSPEVNARTIHTEDDNHDITKRRRSDKFNEEEKIKMKSANFNNTTKNANNNFSSRSKQRDDLYMNNNNRDDGNNTSDDIEDIRSRVILSSSRRTSGHIKDHRDRVEEIHNRNSNNDDDDNEANNSSVDNNVNDCNEDDNYPHHRHNHYYHSSDNNSGGGRPPSRPPSSTSSTSFKTHQQHNSNNLKFSIDDILRPDFGHNKVFNRIPHQPHIFNPFLISPSLSSEGNRSHHLSGSGCNQQMWNSKELLSPSSHTSSISSSNKKHRTGSVSSTDGHRPYRPSSVHCHSEDSNSSCKTREEVVDDTKVNPPVPKGPLLWPAWVYCTRYSDRPSSGPRSRRIRKSPREQPEEKRPRTAFTAEQLARLKQEFDENRYLTEKRRQDLANDLKLHENQIKIWFQNKRAKLKKSTGTKNGLALQLMAQGLYNHSTVPIDEDEEMMDML